MSDEGKGPKYTKRHGLGFLVAAGGLYLLVTNVEMPTPLHLAVGWVMVGLLGLVGAVIISENVDKPTGL